MNCRLSRFLILYKISTHRAQSLLRQGFQRSERRRFRELAAIEFYRTAYRGDPAKAIELYVGAEYIQRNPVIWNGKQAFIDYFTQMADEYSDKAIDLVRAVAEGDLVALHTHQAWPGNEQYVLMNFDNSRMAMRKKKAPMTVFNQAELDS